jgi:hypothetical protein
MRQVIWRTLVRRLRRQELWNGNREPALWTILTDREHIVRWAWTTHHKGQARVTHLIRQRPDLCVVRFTQPKGGRPLAEEATAGVCHRPSKLLTVVCRQPSSRRC